MDGPLWPNLAGLELAPTTANRGAEKNLRAAASVAIVILFFYVDLGTRSANRYFCSGREIETHTMY